MPIILYVVGAWFIIGAIACWWQGGTLAVSGTVAFVGAWLLFALSGVISRLDAISRALGTDTRAVPLKKKKPQKEAQAEETPREQQEDQEQAQPQAAAQAGRQGAAEEAGPQDQAPAEGTQDAPS